MMYLWLSTCLLAGVGLVEWLRQLLADASLTPASEARVLLAVLAVYGAIGAATGFATLHWAAPAERAARALGACAAVAGALFVLGRFGATPRSALPAAATAWVASALATRAARRFPVLASPLLWSLVLAVGTLALMARLLWTAAQTREIAIALAPAAVAFLLASAAFALARGRPDRAIRASALSVLSAAVASAWLGFRVPVARPSGAPPPGAPSVLLVTIDTLRADHVGAYGYLAAHTPHLDGLAREGALFREAVSSAFYTGPSHTSILTGLEPHRHGSQYNGDKLRPDVRTAAGWFRAHGYGTGAFVSGWPTTDRASRLPSRFHHWDDDLREFRLLPPAAYLVPALALLHPIVVPSPRHDGAERPGAQVVDSALEWIEANRGRPFFVWVHLFEPHLPYQPSLSPIGDGSSDSGPGSVDGRWGELPAEERTAIASSPEKVARMLALYDAEIESADEQVGRLLEALRGWVPANDLLTVVTADHGESMGEHGIYWGRDLYDDTLLVPLLIAGCDVEPGQIVTTLVRLVDVLPTLLELAALPVPAAIDGRSLVPLLRGKEAPAPVPAPALSAVYEEPPAHPRDAFSLRQGGWKLIERRTGWIEYSAVLDERVELYDLRSDPDELHDVAAREPERARVLRAQLDAATKEQSEAPHDPLSEEDRELLRALGYVR